LLPKGLAAEIHTSTWTVPAVYEHLRSIGKVPLADWRRTFNLGVGMILCVDGRAAADASEVLHAAGEPHFPVGAVIKQAGGRVVYL